MTKEYLEDLHDEISKRLDLNSRVSVQSSINILYKNKVFWNIRAIEGLSVKRFETFREYITFRPPWGLGWTLKVAEAFIMPELDDIWKVIEGEINEASIKGKHKDKSCYMSHDNNRGNSRDHRISVLKRDAPEIAERVINREISAAEGMRQAGKSKPKINCDATVDAVYNALQRKFTYEERKQLKELL